MHLPEHIVSMIYQFLHALNVCDLHEELLQVVRAKRTIHRLMWNNDNAM